MRVSPEDLESRLDWGHTCIYNTYKLPIMDSSVVHEILQSIMTKYKLKFSPNQGENN